MVTRTKEILYTEEIPRSNAFFLAADIGGTNSNFGIFLLNHEPPLLVLSLQYRSQEIVDFTLFMKEVVGHLHDDYALKVTRGCIGAAGIVYPHRVAVQPTNLSIEINTHDIMKATGIEDLFLINDFEAVALGIELMDKKEIITINPGVRRKHANYGFIGAGTGLGKSFMVWHRDADRYFPVSSEGGHADAAFYNAQECTLNDFIRGEYACPVSWETILSGQGIQKIYRFLGTQKEYPRSEVSEEIEGSNFNPDRISFYASKDERCRETFNWYITFYARCAKNFALDALTIDGIYIAGGIAAKNRGMFFDPRFMKEFVFCGKQSRKLAAIPVFLIADYNVSLYGAVVAARLSDAELW